MSDQRQATYAVIGDVHGHLQLALCTLARWQRELKRTFSGVFLVGDVGTFVDDSQLDNATRRHAEDNPCELEFLTQWSNYPPAPWLDSIFRPEPEGLGLCCPVVMIHGNHEGFAHLETLYPRRRRPVEPVDLSSLPPVDPNGHLQFLPPGWSTRTAEGYRIGGVGGMEAGQRRARYHPMAYIEQAAVDHLKIHGAPLDILLTHQGPAQIQGDHGSPTLDALLDPPAARFWFHGHSTPINTPQTVAESIIVPLGDIAFKNGNPGLKGWSILELNGDEYSLATDPPAFYRELRQKLWRRLPDHRLVHPELARFVV